MYNISFILNYAPHYREAVYRLIDKTFDCRFYFGELTFSPTGGFMYSYTDEAIKELGDKFSDK